LLITDNVRRHPPKAWKWWESPMVAQRRVDTNDQSSPQAAAADLSTASASFFSLSREVRNSRHYQAVSVTLHWFLLSLRKRLAKMRLADSNSGSKSNGQWTYIKEDQLHIMYWYLHIYIFLFFLYLDLYVLLSIYSCIFIYLFLYFGLYLFI
jgi:hypothetical protein